MSDNAVSFELTRNQLMGGLFALGLLTGFTGGTVFNSTGMFTGPQPSETPEQDSNNEGGETTPQQVFTELAAEAGVSEEQFQACYTESTGAETQEDQRNIVNGPGLKGTPTFFVGNSEQGYLQLGPAPVQTFESAVSDVESGEGNFTDLEGVSLEDEPSLGSENASVKIVEYNDYACPACSAWSLQAFDSLKQELIDTGQVEFVVKDFPLRMHPNAPKAHRAAQCVYENAPENYWSFHSALYQNQDRWKA